TGQAATAGASEVLFTEQQSDMRTPLFLIERNPHLKNDCSDLRRENSINWRSFQAATGNPHSSWPSSARRWWFLYHQRSTRLASFRTAHRSLKPPELSGVPSLPLSGTPRRSCRIHSRLPSWVTPKPARSARAPQQLLQPGLSDSS